MSQSEVPSLDLYSILGVERTATEKEITTAYRKLALKYHPDRNQGSEEAAKQFQLVSGAYAVLIDPNKRRQYDLSGGNNVNQTEFECVDIESLGGFQRFLGAVVSRLGVYVPTQVSQNVLHEAFEIAQDRNGLRNSIPSMEFGKVYTGSLTRQTARFYFFNVTSDQSENGIIIRCISPNRSRLKLVLFDDRGSVRIVSESTTHENQKGKTIAKLFFTYFEVPQLYHLPISQMTSEDIAYPTIFTQIETLQIQQQRLEQGKHLLCVYGDNWMNSAHFELTAISLEHSPSHVSQISDSKIKLIQKKKELVDLKNKHKKLKKEMEEMMLKIQEEAKEIEGQFQTRERLLNDLKQFSMPNSFPL